MEDDEPVPEEELRARGRRSPLAAAAARIAGNLRDPANLLPLLLVAGVMTRTVWLDQPPKALIFDEAYYVNAARVILGWEVPVGAAYADAPPGLDPNTEHPPLGKLLIAASMAVFGDDALGWRLPSVIAGMLALVALYLLVRDGGETRRFAILAVALATFDNLMLVHSRIATLDILALTPALVGAWLAVRQRWVLAGALTAVAILMKLTAIYAVAAIVVLLALRVLPRWWRTRRLDPSDLRPPIAFLGTTIVVALVGLWLLDARFTAFTNPFEHLGRMVEYGSNLRTPTTNVGLCPGADSTPFQWPFNECQITYLRVDVTVTEGESVVSARPSIDFRGALNPLLAAAIPFASLFAAWYAWRRRHPIATWAVVWGLAHYLPYVALSILTARIMYLYYFLPVVPAIAIATALLLLRDGQPRLVRWGFAAAYAAGFVAYFPFRQIP